MLVARRRWLDALHVADIFPPAAVPLVGREIVRINVRFPMRHRSAGEINKRNRLRERVIKKKSVRVRLEIGRQYSARLQIRHLTGSERNQFADALMKSWSGAGSQQIRNLRARVGLEIISVAKFVVRGEKPF